MISIIVPVYNTEKYLQECVESILAQTYTYFELLLVDDGSTDGSGDICDEYARKDTRVRVFHKENGGVSSARNIGLDNAKAEWICFVDSDDWLEKEHNSVLLDNRNYELIYFSARQAHEDGHGIMRIPREMQSHNRKQTEDVLFEMKYGSLGDIFGWTWNKFFRRDIIEKNKIRFHEDISFREDELFTMDYCRYIQSVKVVEKVVYNYRIHNQGLTAKGMEYSCNPIFADYMKENLPFYNNEEFVKFEKRRINEYQTGFIDHYINMFKQRLNWRNVISSYREIEMAKNKHQEMFVFATDKQIARIVNYPKWLSIIILELYCIIGSIQRKL